MTFQKEVLAIIVGVIIATLITAKVFKVGA
jgi:hypothetical protein